VAKRGMGRFDVVEPRPRDAVERRGRHPRRARWPGRRLGTVYLGQMPEPGQGTLTEQVTALLQEVLRRWRARGRGRPRLVYITDAGHQPRAYYQKALRRLEDPWSAGRKLSWTWVVDFWHACGYVHKLAEGLFGAGAKSCARRGLRVWTWLCGRSQPLHCISARGAARTRH
jgi:hypothetical protein